MLRPRETPDPARTSFDFVTRPAARIRRSHDVAGKAIAAAIVDTAPETLTVRSRAQVDRGAPARTVVQMGAAASFPFDDSDGRPRGPRGPLPAATRRRDRAAVGTGRAVRPGPADGHAVAPRGSRQRHRRSGLLPGPRDGGHPGAAGDHRRGRGTCRYVAGLFAGAARTLGARFVSGAPTTPQSRCGARQFVRASARRRTQRAARGSIILSSGGGRRVVLGTSATDRAGRGIRRGPPGTGSQGVTTKTASMSAGIACVSRAVSDAQGAIARPRSRTRLERGRAKPDSSQSGSACGCPASDRTRRRR